MEDFDYVSTGGFIMECQEGEMLGLTKSQAERMRQNCIYFQNCFRHGTLESEQQILRKPDWTLAIARHLVEVLTKGRTTVPNLTLYQLLVEAGDQVLLDLRLCSLVNYMDTTYSRNHHFLDLVDEDKYRFRLRANITSDQWLQLLEDKILLHRDETNFVVQLVKDQAWPKEPMMTRRQLDTRVSDYRVHSEYSVQTILHIREMLSTKLEVEAEQEEQFCIYFETTESIPKAHHELIDRLAGGQAYIRTCADAAQFQTEGYTVRASLDVLQRCLSPLKESTHNLECSFRIQSPTPDTLGRFINACQLASDYPNTLGLDPSLDRFYCRKTLSDVHKIVAYLADYSTSARVQGDFQLIVASEDELF